MNEENANGMKTTTTNLYERRHSEKKNLHCLTQMNSIVIIALRHSIDVDVLYVCGKCTQEIVLVVIL